MKNKDEILNQVRIKYNKSLTEEETLNILKRNHNEPIISPDECYLAMESYAKQKLQQHSVMQAEGSDGVSGAAVGKEREAKGVSEGKKLQDALDKLMQDDIDRYGELRRY